jgi:putative inorganic carbon (hco3(-)) transporter
VRLFTGKTIPSNVALTSGTASTAPDPAMVVVELVALALAGPGLLFPASRPALTAIGLAVLAGTWLYRWSRYGQPWPGTPFNGPLLLFAVMIPIGVWASVFPDLTLPKLCGLILGLGTFRVFAFTFGTRRLLPWGLAALGLIGLAILAAGLAATQWPDKMPVFSLLAQRVRGLGAVGAINPNEFAGAMTLFVPIAGALVAAGLAARQPRLALVGLVSLALSAGALALTQSRGGLLGAFVGLAALAVLWALRDGRRWVRWLAVLLPLALLVALLTAGLLIGPGRISQELAGSGSEGGLTGAVGQVSVAGRVEIWSRAVYAIRDFPYTGLGLGAFRRVVRVLYPLFLIDRARDIGHAHNIFLQTALDLGLPGLIAYLALLGVAAAAAWQSSRSGEPLTRAAALGLLGGLIALHVFGMTDALALGSKPGIAFWAALGLIAGLVSSTVAQENHQRASQI